MVVLGVGVVEIGKGLMDVVMTALQDIACRRTWVVGVVGVVGCIEVLPVNLRRLVVASLPEVHEMVVGCLVHRRTYEVAVMADEARTHITLTGRSILADEQTPGIVVAVLVKELISTALLAVRVSYLAVPVVRRHVAVVVRSRVRSVVEVNRGVRIEREMVACCHFNLLLLVDIVVKRSDDRRVVGLHIAGVTHFAVLVAPVRIVIDASRQVVRLLRHSRVLAAEGRSTEGDKTQTLVLPYFLRREEIAQRVVLNTFADDVLLVDVRRETEGELSGKSPSVGQHTAGVRRVHTGFVVTVRTRYADFPALRITARAHQVIGRLTDSAEREVGCLHRVENLFVTARIVQTAHRAEVETTALGCAEVQTFDVVVLHIRLITAVTVTNGGPGKRGRGIEYIRGCR